MITGYDNWKLKSPYKNEEQDTTYYCINGCETSVSGDFELCDDCKTELIADYGQAYLKSLDDLEDWETIEFVVDCDQESFLNFCNEVKEQECKADSFMDGLIENCNVAMDALSKINSVA